MKLCYLTNFMGNEDSTKYINFTSSIVSFRIRLKTVNCQEESCQVTSRNDKYSILRVCFSAKLICQ